MKNCPFKIGDTVRIVRLHDGLQDAPPETIAIYQKALMRPLRVDGIGRKGEMIWVELNVNDDGKQGSGASQHMLCVPPEELELVKAGPVA